MPYRFVNKNKPSAFKSFLANFANLGLNHIVFLILCVIFYVVVTIFIFGQLWNAANFIDSINTSTTNSYGIKILNDNPNFSDNNSSWLTYKTTNGYDNKKIILINNKDSLKKIKENKYELIFKNSSLGFYKILDQKQNCFYLEKYD